jgi:hypothetical protein
MRTLEHKRTQIIPDVGDRVYFPMNRNHVGLTTIKAVDGTYLEFEFDCGIGTFEASANTAAIDSSRAWWDKQKQAWQCAWNIRNRSFVFVPDEIKEYAKKNKLGFIYSEWHSDEQWYDDWRRSGTLFYSPLGRKRRDELDKQGLFLREKRDVFENTIRLEVWICEITPPDYQNYLYQPKKLIYEWRNNGGFKGVYFRSEELTGEGEYYAQD